MKIKLWKVHLKNQNSRYWADTDNVTVQAPNARCAIDRAIKLTYLTPKAKRRSMIESVELIGVSEN